MTDIDQDTQQVVPAPDWEHVRLEYLNANLEAAAKDGVPPTTLKVMAERYGLNYGTLRNRASEEDWNGQLKLMVQTHKAALDDRVVHLTMQSEIEIRARQISFARVAQSKAMLRLQALKDNELTPKEAIDLLKLGTELERKAAGMDDEFVAPKQDNVKTTQTREAVRQAFTALEKFRARLGLSRQNVAS